MKKIPIIVSALCVSLSLGAPAARAVGIGGYGYGSYGAGHHNYGELSYLSSQNDSTEKLYTTIVAGGGLIIDTNCARDELFSYRFTIGGAGSFSTALAGLEKTTRVILSNTFCFGLVRTGSMRFWIGPQLGAGTFSGRFDRKKKDYLYTQYLNGIPYYNTSYPLTQTGIRYSLLGIIPGLALGVNFNFEEPVTLALECGVRYHVYFGIKSATGLVALAGGGAAVPVRLRRNTWTRSIFVLDGYVQIGLMYRYKDDYSSLSTGADSE